MTQGTQVLSIQYSIFNRDPTSSGPVRARLLISLFSQQSDTLVVRRFKPELGLPELIDLRVSGHR